VEVLAVLISNVTDAVEQERQLWQNRPLDALYPIVYYRTIQEPLQASANQYRTTQVLVSPQMITKLTTALIQESLNPQTRGSERFGKLPE